MKSRFLFPHKWRMIGYLCFAADLAFTIMLKMLHPEGYVYADLHPVTGSVNNLRPDIIIDQGTRWHNDIIILLIIFGLLLIAFSKEIIEDEQITQLRLDSLQWAVYLNYGIFIVCVIFFNGVRFIPVVVFNLVTPLIFFIIRFRWKVYTLNGLLNNAEL